MRTPKNTLDKLNKLKNAWQTLAPEKSFGGMTLEQFKALVQPSYEARDLISTLEDQLSSVKSRRDDADKESMRIAQVVINGIVGDPTEGPDSDIYEASGYIRKSERKSGLSRKPKTAPTSGNLT